MTLSPIIAATDKKNSINTYHGDGLARESHPLFLKKHDSIIAQIFYFSIAKGLKSQPFFIFF